MTLILLALTAMKTQKRNGNQLTIIERANYFARIAKKLNKLCVPALIGNKVDIGENSTSTIKSYLPINVKINIRALL